jgi:hypothetical protein
MYFCSPCSTTIQTYTTYTYSQIGNFFYNPGTNDNYQEIDYEYLTSSASLSQNPANTKNLFYTNWTPAKTTTLVPAPSNAQTALHEYRIDWLPSKTLFYLDGVQTSVLTTNVPSTPGLWVWNNWSNGDPGFSVGPPASDSIFKIASITMYYNASGTATQCTVVNN